jgi:two-component system cell cycle sensor histidine kinase/response regulator CckA
MAIRPRIHIILCTGFSELINREGAIQSGIGGFIMKPYSLSTLAKVIRTVLEK